MQACNKHLWIDAHGLELDWLGQAWPRCGIDVEACWRKKLAADTCNEGTQNHVPCVAGVF